MSDMWAYCDPCGRWFYPEATGDGVPRHPLCPVCSTEAALISEEPGQPA